MRDLPIFTTQYGVASLTLSEIPYKQEAYIRLQATEEPEKLLEECIAFCRACGAERIFATGHLLCEQYSLYTEIWQMRCLIGSLPVTDAALFPVQEKTLQLWKDSYNQRMRKVPNAATMTNLTAQALLKEGSGYFVHRGDQLIGIGKACGDRIDAVASLVPGYGKDVVCALSHALSGDCAIVEVASNNIPAISLYKRLGFIPVTMIAKWHRVYG